MKNIIRIICICYIANTQAELLPIETTNEHLWVSVKWTGILKDMKEENENYIYIFSYEDIDISIKPKFPYNKKTKAKEEHGYFIYREIKNFVSDEMRSAWSNGAICMTEINSQIINFYEYNNRLIPVIRNDSTVSFKCTMQQMLKEYNKSLQSDP